jgi:hypothetical protein
MSRYAVVEIGPKKLRKNRWLPCAISARFDEMSEEEQRRTLKETYWADYITDAEWQALLEHDGCSPSARSRLKKKAAGWYMALGRIAYLNPKLYNEITARSIEMYAEQIGEGHPAFESGRGEEPRETGR